MKDKAMEATKEEVKEDKLIAILTRPGIEPVVVEITDTDKKSWTAFVLSPAGLEYHVSIDDLHGVEHIVDGKRKFMGEPRRTPEKDIPNNIVVRDQKEVHESYFPERRTPTNSNPKVTSKKPAPQQNGTGKEHPMDGATREAMKKPVQTNHTTKE